MQHSKFWNTAVKDTPGDTIATHTQKKKIILIKFKEKKVSDSWKMYDYLIIDSRQTPFLHITGQHMMASNNTTPANVTIFILLPPLHM